MYRLRQLDFALMVCLVCSIGCSCKPRTRLTQIAWLRFYNLLASIVDVFTWSALASISTCFACGHVCSLCFDFPLFAGSDSLTHFHGLLGLLDQVMLAAHEGNFWNLARHKLLTFSKKREFLSKIEVEHDFSKGLSKRVTLKFTRPPSNLTRIGNPYDFATASSCTSISKYRGLTLT